MTAKYIYTAKNLQDTEKFARNFRDALGSSGVLICLYGDIGSGKTTFVKYLANFLGITQKVTSPSFVILNEYHSEGVDLYHFDLYRLEKEGVDTILDELSEYTEEENSVTVIEWAEFSSGNLPDERVDIKIKYVDDVDDINDINEYKREFEVTAYGAKNNTILEKLRRL